MSKLYTVRVSFDYVIVAEDIHDAYTIAPEYARDALFDMNRNDIDLAIVQGVSAYKWDDECIPYNGDGNTRTGEYLKGVV